MKISFQNPNDNYLLNYGFIDPPFYKVLKKELTLFEMYEVHTISFQTFFRIGTFIDSTHVKL